MDRRISSLSWISIAFSLVISMPAFCETLQYRYDGLNRLVQVIYGDNVVITYKYDEAGNRLQKTISKMCRGDFDGDGEVDKTDLSVLAKDFGRSHCSANCEADFDGDDDVDGADLAAFAADFGRTDCPISP